MGAWVLTENDGSFRRLAQMIKNQRAAASNQVGRPSKNRVPITGYLSLPIHQQMKALAQQRTERAGHLVSTSDLYNEAAQQMIADLHYLLGDELLLPAGAVTLSGVLGLRELIDRPVVIPLRELQLRPEAKQRTTLYLDPPVSDILIEMSLRFGLQMRRTLHVQPLLEMAAAWYLAGLETECED